jgi:heat shock protein 90kDa beta
VRRVLITEEFEELMPRYLNFIKGVVDSDDLPLNVSREQLQQLKMIKVMSKKLIRKAIEMIKALAEEDEEDDDEDDEDNEESTDESKEEESEDDKKDTEKKDEEDKYGKFWKNFGKNIKLGVIEDASNRSKLAKLLRFYSTHDTEKLISLDEYISRMKPDQDTILYLPGDSKEGILKSPILKKYQKSGYEVLLLGDPIDEFCVQHLSEYEKRKVKSIAKDDVNILDGSDEISKKKLQKLKEMYKPLTEWFKKTLGKEVEKVIISNKLEDDPVYILTSQYGYSAQMEKINRAQAFANQEKAASHMLAKKTLELNPHHPVIKEMLTRVKGAIGGEIDDSVKEYAILLYNMALLNSGFLIENPADFIAPMQKLLKVGFGMKSDAPVEEIEVDISSEEEAATEQEQESPEEPDVAGEVEEEDTKRNEEL